MAIQKPKTRRNVDYSYLTRQHGKLSSKDLRGNYILQVNPVTQNDLDLLAEFIQVTFFLSLLPTACLLHGLQAY